MARGIDTLSYPHKTSEYTYRVPTPPRIVVPPPTLNADALPTVTLSALQSAHFPNNVNYTNLVTQNALLEWTYERRREAQMILPFLYLGPMTTAKDESFLRGETGHGVGDSRVPGGITMVLGVRQKHSFESKLMHGALRKARELGIACETVDLANNQDLIQKFPQTTAIINNHLAQHHQQTGQLGKVLVVCESGNERSAGVVAAFLMDTHTDVDYIKAMQLVQAQRFCANFDDAMKRLLQGYWDILCARRQVEAVHEADLGTSGGMAGMVGLAGDGQQYMSTKRGLSRDEDEDMDGVDQDDLERFGGRTFAPFMDRTI